MREPQWTVGSARQAATLAAVIIGLAGRLLPATAITIAPVTTTDIAARTAIAVDPQNRSHVLFERTEAGVRTLVHAVRRGTTWSFEPIDQVMDFDSPPGLAVVDSADVRVVYISDASGAPELRYAHRSAGGSWFYEGVPLGSAMTPTACDLAVTPAGDPIVVASLWNGDNDPTTSASELRLMELASSVWTSALVDTGPHIRTCAIALAPSGDVGLAYGVHHSPGFSHSTSQPPGDWDLVFAERSSRWELGPRTDFVAGTNANGVAIGDVNADARPDLVVANFGASSVSVLLGDGAGGFGAKTDFATDIRPTSVVIGDLSGDGKPDLAVACGGGVSVLLGTGTGGFGASNNFITGGSPQSVATGDLNGDGKLDLAVANLNNFRVSVLLGDGLGGFSPKVDYVIGASPMSVAIGDLNLDGKPDLAVAYSGGNAVAVLLGSGAGAFGAKTDFATGLSPGSVAIADVNGDGRLDLVSANLSSNTVSVLLGDSAGGFGAKTDFATGAHPYSVAVADMNGDHRPDLVSANLNSNTVSVLLGDGVGGFLAKVDFVTGVLPFSVAIGDVSGDGKPDVAVANYTSSSVSVLLARVRAATWSREYPGANGPNWDLAHAVDVAYLSTGQPLVAAVEDRGAFQYNYGNLYMKSGPGPWPSAILDSYVDGHSTLQVALAIDSHDHVRAATSNGNPPTRTGVKYLGFLLPPYPEFGIDVEPEAVGGPAADYVSLAFDLADHPQLMYLRGAFPTPAPQDGAAAGAANFDLMFADSASGNSGAGVDSRPGSNPLALRAWPTPFRTALRYSLTLPRDVRDLRVDVVDLEGRIVATLWSGTSRSGELNLEWNVGGPGRPVRSGVYWIRARAGNLRSATKVIRLE